MRARKYGYRKTKQLRESGSETGSVLRELPGKAGEAGKCALRQDGMWRQSCPGCENGQNRRKFPPFSLKRREVELEDWQEFDEGWRSDGCY